jgi:hypothetical protein
MKEPAQIQGAPCLWTKQHRALKTSSVTDKEKMTIVPKIEEEKPPMYAKLYKRKRRQELSNFEINDIRTP